MWKTYKDKSNKMKQKEKIMGSVKLRIWANGGD